MTTINEVNEEIDEEDELDGWGPVRVRRSSMPAQSDAPLSMNPRDAKQLEALRARAVEAERIKRLMT
jgi:hypothetical protein